MIIGKLNTLSCIDKIRWECRKHVASIPVEGMETVDFSFIGYEVKSAIKNIKCKRVFNYELLDNL